MKANVGSVLLVFLVLGYGASAAHEIPDDSNLKEYLDDTLPYTDDESDSQKVMDEIKGQSQEGHLKDVEGKKVRYYEGESLQLYNYKTTCTHAYAWLKAMHRLHILVI